ncbi:unnamed protein product [Brassicogethes aeneus]|uniref:MARVEL domain-containing protein n=1 Tax=Brassicogethes aeneus TaxID=1431903 RepID=A0A9P0FKN7_BRAAE|nr:unnamed protein product [Brassicogethes aeneus]
MNYCTFDGNMYEDKDQLVFKPGGYQYVVTYSGGIKTIEQVFSVTIICFLLLNGQQSRTYFLFGISLLSLILSAIFSTIHIFTSIERTFMQLYWIEFGFSLAFGLFFILASTAVWTIYTQWFIVISVLGYATAAAYLLDTVNQFRLAQVPRSRYVWTTPNMPA